MSEQGALAKLTLRRFHGVQYDIVARRVWRRSGVLDPSRGLITRPVEVRIFRFSCERVGFRHDKNNGKFDSMGRYMRFLSR